MKTKTLSWSSLILIAFLLGSMVAFTACGDDDAPVTPDPPAPDPDPVVTDISASPTSLSLLSKAEAQTSVTITTTGNWNISGCPDWLHLTATSGYGITTITLTALSENFSGDARSATLTASTETSSASFTVSQEPALAQYRVSISNKTIMSDGFACDLTFSSGVKGYREAFFTESALQNLTERDLFNKLMEKSEYSGSVEYTYSPIVDPNTTIIYCVAAYGNENNADGSHKYGPMTVERITTAASTPYADMPISLSYTSTRWTATTYKDGNYGTRCNKYYYFYWQGTDADFVNELWTGSPYAALAHFLYKPIIKDAPNRYATSPQSFTITRTDNQFFFGTWGVDDTNQFSAEHLKMYRDFSSATAQVTGTRTPVESSKWNEPRKIFKKSELKKLYENVKVYSMEQ